MVGRAGILLEATRGGAVARALSRSSALSKHDDPNRGAGSKKPTLQFIGVDIDPQQLGNAAANLTGWRGSEASVSLLWADATALPLASGSGSLAG